MPLYWNRVWQNLWRICNNYRTIRLRDWKAFVTWQRRDRRLDYGRQWGYQLAMTSGLRRLETGNYWAVHSSEPILVLTAKGWPEAGIDRRTQSDESFPVKWHCQLIITPTFKSFLEAEKAKFPCKVTSGAFLLCAFDWKSIDRAQFNRPGPPIRSPSGI